MGTSASTLLRAAFAAAAAVLAAGCGALGPGSATPRAPVLPRSTAPTEQLRLEPLLENAVASMSGAGIEVHCWAHEQWQTLAAQAARAEGLQSVNDVLGYADPQTRTIHLAPRVCEALAVVAARPGGIPPGGPALEVAQALVTVGHEAGHLTPGFEPEPAAECFGIQHVSQVAQALGASEPQGELLASFYWGQVYPIVAGIYHSPECRDGGALDLDPVSSDWP